MKKLALIALLAVSVCAARLTFAEDKDASTSQPSDAPVKVDPTDKDALKAAEGKNVTLDGTIEKAAWASSGKILKATFKGNDSLSIVIFQKHKDDFDKAFNGDITKALAGAKIRVHGELKDYKGSPELVLDDPEQLTIQEPASDSKASQ